MPDDQLSTAVVDPGFGDVPDDPERDQDEDEADEHDLCIAELAERDLDDPTTPSRRTATGEPAPGSFDVPLVERTKERTNGG